MSRRRFAEDTDIPVSQSKVQLEALLTRHGADQFFSAWQEGAAALGFRLGGRMIRITLALPARAERRFTHTDAGKLRTESATQDLWEQACRARWRALLLIVKAKLVGVEEGITTLEREFLADLVLPDNSTVGQRTLPQIADAYRTGTTPDLLAGLLPAPEVLT